MNFDIYWPYVNKKGVTCPGVRPVSTPWEQVVGIMKDVKTRQLVEGVRAGNKDCKLSLPAICWTAIASGDYRKANNGVPTQLVMIDIDHVEDPQKSWREIEERLGKHEYIANHLLFAAVTCSGHGLRLVFWACTANSSTIEGQMTYLDEKLHFGDFGDFDKQCKDMCRLSFLGLYDEVLYEDVTSLTGSFTDMMKVFGSPIVNKAKTDKSETPRLEMEGATTFTTDEEEKFRSFMYRDHLVSEIVKKYVEVKGEPSSGEIHNYYNEMVKNFRCICDNNKRLLLFTLPRFGHTYEECWSQIVSICRVNTLSRLPKDFYFFLKDNGFYKTGYSGGGEFQKYMMSDEEPDKTGVRPPYLPPVFRELVGSAPDDFVLSCINSLLPILGTLTSYLKAVYPYDNREHTTSFFSVIYAPPSTGKGFVERYLDLLFEDLRMRDLVQSERENVYLRIIAKKGANDKAPDLPHVSLRLIPPKNSEAEFLQKQRDNQGYHMFTYAAEMDSWAKGVRAAGGNKDDMIRIAWDNGEYGQQFKSANTFKGTVKLFWNVLITGTIAQVENYFKNVENGLVTRCSFTTIENQEFRLPPRWGSLSKRGMETLQNFTERCDRRTYTEPCHVTIDDLKTVNDDNFDSEIQWRFTFRPRQEVNMDWIMPTIDKFHRDNMSKAALDVDRARDVFRRRVGVRGFRLALLCYGLWENPRKSDLEKCIPFIRWWMEKDLESMLKLWGAKYNEITDVTEIKVQRTVYDELGETFSKNDVYEVCLKQGIKTPLRRILFEWKKLGYVKSFEGKFTKIKKK